jgi:hypothetical protein
MTIRLNGSTSGYAQLDSAAVGGNNTLVLPTTNGTANQALVTDGSGTLSFADRGRMTLATAQATTSGTSIDFTGIPSWVKRVIVMLNGVGISGTSGICAQIGAGSIDTSGYTGASMVLASGAGSAGLTASSNWPLSASWDNSAYRISGHLTLTTVSTNLWVLSFCYGHTNGTSRVGWGGGSKTLSGTLDRLRITSSNGSDTFTAGSINILYEG